MDLDVKWDSFSDHSELICLKYCKMDSDPPPWKIGMLIFLIVVVAFLFYVS